MISVKRTRISKNGYAPIQFKGKLSADDAAQQLQSLIRGKTSAGQIRGLRIGEEISEIAMTWFLDSTGNRKELVRYSGSFENMRELIEIVEMNLPDCLHPRKPVAEETVMEILKKIIPLEDSGETLMAVPALNG